MWIPIINKIFLPFISFLVLVFAASDAVAANSALLEAKKEAEAKGYTFITSHDEIVAGAKKEGQLRIMTGLEPPNFQPLIDGFKQKYPFVTDVGIAEISGRASYQKILLEIKTGEAKGWDITRLYIDYTPEYIPYLMKHDILSMAKHGVLKIDPRMVHPVERNIVSVMSVFSVVPYNKKLISDDKVPGKWEDILKPEFKGRKFVVDIRPNHIAALVPAWGLEKTLAFARKLAAQKPAWGRGGTRMTMMVAAGEYPFYVASNFGSINRSLRRDKTGNLSYKIIEPVATRIVDQPHAIINTADHPYTALLWLEFLASPEALEIIDKYEPLKASAFSPDSEVAKAIRGKKLSVVGWDHLTKFQGYGEKIVEAWGFPKADKRR